MNAYGNPANPFELHPASRLPRYETAAEKIARGEAPTVNKNSRIVWEGASPFDGSEIVVILAGFAHHSENGKTGGVFQLFILRRDCHPADAIKTGLDVANCNKCFHRKNEFGPRTCYVRASHGPAGVWESYACGNIEYMTDDDYAALADNGLRLGTYGDPAAIPLDIVAKLADSAAYVLGYTHNWMYPEYAGYRKYCMASCDTNEEYYAAAAMGWRIFRVAPHNDSTTNAKEILCRAIAIDKQCADCRICGGLTKSKVPNAFIPAHGTQAKQVARKLAVRKAMGK